MTATHTLQLPLSERDVQALHAGDIVYLDGEIVITAGLPTHERMLKYLDEGRALPVDLRGAAVFHLGSYSRDIGGVFEVLYMNPTTSTRFNPHMPRLIRALGLRAVGGKGGLDEASAEAMREVGCVYLSFLGGGCTLLSRAIKEVVSVDWDDLIAHYRLVRLRVEQLGPLTVGIDAHGNSLYADLLESARARLPDILADLRAKRATSQTS
jgi:fumarate hydratase subunit beta